MSTLTSRTKQHPARLFSQRHDAQELLDLGVGTPQDVKANFDDMARINRWLGGIRALTQHLYPRLLKHTTPISILDIGTGAAQIPAVIAAWAQKRGLPVRIFAIDLAARNLSVANKNPAVNLIQADIAALPFAEKSVDYVISSLFLHHFTPQQNIQLLRYASKIARHSVIMSDLVRSPLAQIAFKASQPIFARSYLTRYDGALSIRRAYTPAELSKLADAAALPHFHIHNHLLWRMTLVSDHV